VSGGGYRDAINPSERWHDESTNVLTCISTVPAISDQMNNLTPRMRREASYRGRLRVVDDLYIIMTQWSNFGFWRPIVFVAILISLPVLFRCDNKRAWTLMCMLVIGYSAIIVCAFQPPLTRYITQTFLVEIMLAMTGGFVFMERLLGKATFNASG
jgi:hypothetical protein